MPSYKVIHGEGEQLSLLELGTKSDLPAADIRPKDGLVLVCTWGGCVSQYRPVSGLCRDCSQVNWIYREFVTPYHFVVEDGYE